MKTFNGFKFQKSYKKIKLSNRLLINYILIIILMILLLIIMLFGYVFYSMLTNNSEDVLFASDIIERNYKEIDASKVVKNGGFIIVVDKDLKIIREENSDKNLGYKYNSYDFYRIIQGHEYKDKYFITTEIGEKNNFILIVGTAVERIGLDGQYEEKNMNSTKYNKKKIGRKIGFVSIIVFLFGTIILYSKLTSRTFVEPLKELLKGVNKLKNGDYSTRVDVGDTISELAQLKDAFNLMAEKIQEQTKLKEKSEENRKQMILNISHDLKNPLTSIQGYSEFLLKNNEYDIEKNKKILKVINDNSIKANQLIQELFQYSHIESTGYIIDIEKNDICEFLRELIATCIPQMEEKGFEYDFEIMEERIIIPFDRTKLDRALSNLIVNSIKYNNEGTKIFIGLDDYDNYVEITIKDNGIGIPKELKNDIFRPFVRVDSSRNSKTGGTGLGLAISKGIIEKHGGSLELIDNQEKGCEFKIRLNK